LVWLWRWSVGGGWRCHRIFGAGELARGASGRLLEFLTLALLRIKNVMIVSTFEMFRARQEKAVYIQVWNETVGSRLGGDAWGVHIANCERKNNLNLPTAWHTSFLSKVPYDEELIIGIA
jgi:hypothetical protein